MLKDEKFYQRQGDSTLFRRLINAIIRKEVKTLVRINILILQVQGILLLFTTKKPKVGTWEILYALCVSFPSRREKNITYFPHKKFNKRG
jgi:hypothetical protein